MGSGDNVGPDDVGSRRMEGDGVGVGVSTGCWLAVWLLGSIVERVGKEVGLLVTTRSKVGDKLVSLSSPREDVGAGVAPILDEGRVVGKSVLLLLLPTATVGANVARRLAGEGWMVGCVVGIKDDVVGDKSLLSLSSSRR